MYIATLANLNFINYTSWYEMMEHYYDTILSIELNSC